MASSEWPNLGQRVMIKQLFWPLLGKYGLIVGRQKDHYRFKPDSTNYGWQLIRPSWIEKVIE